MSKVRYLLGLTDADRRRVVTALRRSIEVENSSAESGRLDDLIRRLDSFSAMITEAEYAYADDAARAWLGHVETTGTLGKRFPKTSQQVVLALAKLRGLFS